MSPRRVHETRIRFTAPIYLVSLAAFLALPQYLFAAPDPCTPNTETGELDCRGDQSAGIVLAAPPVAQPVRVDALTQPIEVSSDAIRFTSGSGSDLVLYTGAPGANVVLTTTGDAARGVYLSSIGQSPPPPNDALLNVPIPGTPGVSGGVITAENHGDISTDGRGAHGIYGYSSTSGYPDSMITALENFDPAGITFNLVGVADPDGGELQAVTAAEAVTLAGRVVDYVDLTDPNDETPPYVQAEVQYFGTAGSFTVNEDGSFSFDPGTDFDDLAEGEARTVKVLVSLDGYRDGAGPLRTGEPGYLSARVENVGGTLVTRTFIEFDTFGLVEFGETSSGTAWPDLDVYVRGAPDTDPDPDIDNSIPGLLGEARGVSGGAGSTVNLAHLGGTITTAGAAAHGVYAHSQGQRGTDGRDGGGFWSFGTRPPHAGGDGNDGGDVNLHIDGTVITRFEPAEEAEADASIGVLAHSQGGAGGTGGDGGFYYGGRRGGAGGDAMTVTVNGSGIIETFGRYGSGILAISEGGDGGGGGDGGVFAGGYTGGFGGRGGTVHVEGDWNVTTHGAAAHGIWAKSTGGNAGNGGSGGWLIGAGGAGGQATDGGEVTLRSGGAITTWGADAFGLFGQSVGGFGGSGGAGRSIFYSRGGDGESAGSGGAVSVTQFAGGSVTTHGEGSHGLVSLSVGGGGGAGGSAGGIVAVGGDGASGGNGGMVTAINEGSLTTFGGFARGLYAQSVGGGGGDAGSTGGLVSIGGQGGGGGDGGTVSVDNRGAIETSGAWSEALFAQSIGGGGGSGGSAVGWFSIGGDGGVGGESAAVEVTNTGALTTRGNDASGLFAQSVGGGGGSGGNSVAAGLFGALAIGGTGGEGGAGNTVTVHTSDGAISTSGDRARGIDAQSVGGGGGRGGFAIAASVGEGGSFSLGVGGDGGGGGDSDTVTVTSGSDISTRGDEAQGIFAQSVGGGGGSGGFSIAGAASDGIGVALAFGGQGGTGGASSEVNVTSSGNISTGGLRSVGLFAQSIGGGGGNGGFSIAGSGGGLGGFSLGLGGDGGGGGDSARVTVASHGAINVFGAEAHGIQAQSVGGGGGSGGFSIAAAGGGVGAGAVGLGGQGEGGGNAGVVDVTSDGAITTIGRGAIGLFAQSVGGGGGSGGFAISGAGAGTGAGTFGLGGSAADGGFGNEVIVRSHSDIQTWGSEAHALLAQSVGGGGGNGGFSIGASGAGTGAGSISLGGGGGAGGYSMKVDVQSHGFLATLGDNAIGLFAQSVGGGGGSGGFSISGSGAGTGSGAVSMGGSGDAGGDGGEVEVLSSSAMHTQGTRSHALFAQSVGGGGGSGGFSIAGAGAGTGAGSISLGGTGAGGGSAQRVDVSSSGHLLTEGDSAIGLFAQSVGGGGGNGGFSVAGTGAKTAAGSLSLGGSAGAGGDGGVVDVVNEGVIETLGKDATGLFAQSVGGGGGNGGFSVAGSLTGGGESSVAASVSVGGGGGLGGDAETVDVINTGDVWTAGDNAGGILAQSIGGGGGNGGFSIAGTFLGAYNASVAVGGSGGGGGAGRAVTVDNTGNIMTQGSEAHGIRAESTSDGGGDGGFALAGSLGGKEAKNLSVTVGGSGGEGGAAGTVQVDSEGEIATAGQGAHGIMATSIGGGGGTGGSAISVGFGLTGEKGWNVNASAAIGGTGGDGGIGGDVFVGSAERPVDGQISTRGDDAHGIFAQSIGGGGGSGGSSTAINIDVDRPKPEPPADGGDGEEKPEGNSLNASLSIGGSGGEGNYAGNVVVDSVADIATFGAQSHGIFAQSIGGGGGGGGRAAALSLSTGDLMPWVDMQGDNWGLDVAIGGSGGGGNDAGTVTVTNRGAIYTEGALARGIFAQSIGGGGGSGAQGVLGSGVNWVDDALEALSPIQTAFAIKGIIENPKALLPKSGSLKVGGGDGVSGDADAVFVDNIGDITTLGMSSHAIYAQSVGGGGGEAQLYARARGEEDEDGDAEEAWVGIGVVGDLLLGGADGAAGNGGRVDVLHSGNIYTEGQAASGIYAQSVGGGGGQAGSVEGGLADPLQLGLGFEYQREGGGDGDGGFVNVASSGVIFTSGEASVGIFAQSVGGGGGVIGNVGGVAFAGSVGGAGAGGDVSVTHTGDIVTGGNAAHGIMAQSAGGTVETGPAAGQVTVTVDGHIQASGADASGIVAQSVGGGAGVDASNGNVSVLIEAGGSVIGGSGNGAGVRVLDGLDNTIANYGTVGALSDLAVVAGAGNDALANHGALYGAVDLGAGSNSMVNQDGAVMHTGASIELGAGNTLTNAGRLSPGGDGVVASTAIGGHLLQTGSGALSIDLDTAGMTADYLAVGGDASLDGVLGVRMLDIGYVMPGSHSLTLLTAGGGLLDQGLALQTATSAVVDYALEFEADGELVLHYVVDFSAPEGLSDNQGALGDYVNRLQSAGGSAAFAPLAAQLFTLPDGEALGAFYDRLSPAPHFGTGNATLAANQQFSSGMLSCRQHGGLYRFTGETDCSWLRLAGRKLTRDRVEDDPGFEEQVISVAGGAQQEVGEDLFVGAALSYETGRVKSAGLARTELDRFQGGLMVKKQNGHWLGAAGLTVGFGQFDAERYVDLPDPGVVATSRQGMQFAALRGRLAYTVERDSWYFKPMLDANVTWADFDGYREQGAGGANLIVASRNETYTSVNPALEVGVEVQADETGFTRLYGRIGAVHYLSGTPEITATLDGAPAGVAPFRTQGELDETYLDVALGVDLVRGKDFGVKFEYSGQLSSDTDQHGVQLKFARRF